MNVPSFHGNYLSTDRNISDVSNTLNGSPALSTVASNLSDFWVHGSVFPPQTTSSFVFSYEAPHSMF